MANYGSTDMHVTGPQEELDRLEADLRATATSVETPAWDGQQDFTLAGIAGDKLAHGYQVRATLSRQENALDLHVTQKYDGDCLGYMELLANDRPNLRFEAVVVREVDMPAAEIATAQGASLHYARLPADRIFRAAYVSGTRNGRDVYSGIDIPLNAPGAIPEPLRSHSYLDRSQSIEALHRHAPRQGDWLLGHGLGLQAWLPEQDGTATVIMCNEESAAGPGTFEVVRGVDGRGFYSDAKTASAAELVTSYPDLADKIIAEDARMSADAQPHGALLIPTEGPALRMAQVIQTVSPEKALLIADRLSRQLNERGATGALALGFRKLESLPADPMALNGAIEFNEHTASVHRVQTWEHNGQTIVSHRQELLKLDDTGLGAVAYAVRGSTQIGTSQDSHVPSYFPGFDGASR